MTNPENPPHKFKLTAYPNPFNSRIKIGFTLSQPKTVVIHLFDISGRNVREIDIGYYNTGNHEAVLDAAGLVAGIYYLGIKDDMRSIPIVLIR